MLEEAREYLSKLQLLKEQQEAEKDKEYVQLHIEILTYLIDCAEQVEAARQAEDLLMKPEGSQ